jgi:hypothetical protein
MHFICDDKLIKDLFQGMEEEGLVKVKITFIIVLFIDS